MDTKIEERFIDIEIVISNQQKMLDELSEVVISQGKMIDTLIKENALLLAMIKDESVRPLSEETPPPHY